MTEQQIKLFKAYLNEKSEHYELRASAYEKNLKRFGATKQDVANWRTRSETVREIREEFIRFFERTNKEKKI